jgi:hypothetical protein
MHMETLRDAVNLRIDGGGRSCCRGGCCLRDGRGRRDGADSLHAGRDRRSVRSCASVGDFKGDDGSRHRDVQRLHTAMHGDAEADICLD